MLNLQNDVSQYPCSPATPTVAEIADMLTQLSENQCGRQTIAKITVLLDLALIPELDTPEGHTFVNKMVDCQNARDQEESPFIRFMHALETNQERKFFDTYQDAVIRFFCPSSC